MALALGCHDPNQLLQLDNTTFCEWQAFARIEPFGYWAEESRIAAMRSDIHNGSGRYKPTIPNDFMPKPKLTKEQSLQRCLTQLQRNYRAHLNGKKDS